jgi:hypothetical protein
MIAIFNFGNFSTTAPFMSFDTQDNLVRQYLDQSPGQPSCQHYRDGQVMVARLPV